MAIRSGIVRGRRMTAFGGAGMMDLFVTEVETGAVYRLRPGVAGLVPFRDPRPAVTTT